MAEDTETEEADSYEQEDPEYVVDPARVSELSRSLESILLSRRCPSCKARLQETGEIPSVEAQIKEIEECCGNKEGFIRPEMPMQEIVFRTLLAGGNVPVSLSQLHYQVTDRWYTPANPRSISVAGLKTVLDADLYYGFKEVPQPLAEISAPAPAKTSAEAPDQTAAEAPDQTAAEAADQTAAEAPDQTAAEAPEQTTAEAPEQTAAEAPEQTTAEAAEQTAGGEDEAEEG